jgi:hypothetical protein
MSNRLHIKREYWPEVTDLPHFIVELDYEDQEPPLILSPVCKTDCWYNPIKARGAEGPRNRL